MLKLRIENFDQLPDGGPLEFAANRHGFDFGRDQHLDWTLPDPSGAISRKHCEVRFFEQSYWLFDLSTNGTFVNGSKKRIQSPYKLAQGDEIKIGDYLISVTIAPETGGADVFADAPSAPAVFTPSHNFWDSGGEAVSAPIDPRELMPPTPESRRAPDYLQQHVQLPPVPDPPWQGNLAGPAADVWGNEPAPASGRPMAKPPAPPAFEQMPLARPAAAVGASPMPSRPMSSETDSTSHDEFVRRFAIGAGVSPEALSDRMGGELAEELGRLFNRICANLMQVLSARAEAKAMARSGSRTLIRPNENNPLKFTPAAEEALRVMLDGKSHGYLGAAETIEKSFADIKGHQLAVIAAMQLAAQNLLAEFTPEEIRKAADAGKRPLLGSARAKYWEAYSEKWQKRAGQSEHGMLSAFLDLFAHYYDQESGKLK